MKRKRKSGGHAVNPRSAETMLKALKKYTPDFATISITNKSGMTISVTAHGAPAAPPKPTPPKAKEKLTAIEALSKAPPPFEFETEN